MQHGDHSKVLTRDMFDDQHFAKRQIKLVDMYLVSWERYDQMETTISAKDILYIRYEDLKNPEKRMASLRSMVDFLGKFGGDICSCIEFHSQIYYPDFPPE